MVNFSFTGVAGLPLIALLSAAGAVCVVPAAAQDQRIRGVVADVKSQDPLMDVAVTILSTNGQPLQRAENTIRTDSIGQFVFRNLAPGSYLLRATRIGFQTITTNRIDLEEFHEVSVQLAMDPTATLLAPMIITENVNILSTQLQDFWSRKRAGLGGVHFGPEDLATRGTVDLTSVLRIVPGTSMSGFGPQSQVRFRRTNCIPTFYLDGVRVLDNGAESPLSYINVTIPKSEYYAVEVYQDAAYLPARFSSIRDRCGVVVVWTKRGIK